LSAPASSTPHGNEGRNMAATATALALLVALLVIDRLVDRRR
jgi:hypothetical protein